MNRIGTDNRAISISRLLMALGVLLALSSSFQFSSVWVHGEYEYGGSVVVWDGIELVLWPTYYLSQVIGIDLVCGGIMIFHIGIESSYLRIAKKLAFLIGGLTIIYYFLNGYVSLNPGLVAGVVSLFLLVVMLDTTNYADRIRAWFGEL